MREIFLPLPFLRFLCLFAAIQYLAFPLRLSSLREIFSSSFLCLLCLFAAVPKLDFVPSCLCVDPR
jgi:hypothetical protein